MRGDHDGLVGAHDSAAGFILVEVMISVIMLGIVLVPLATSMQRAMNAGVALRDEASALSESTLSDPSADAWTWGPMVDRVAWKPGPELNIRVRARASAELGVGIWAGGWPLGEWPLDGERSLKVPASALMEVTGEDLVIRVREVDGTWGPPCRSIVPNEYCVIVAEPAVAKPEVDTCEGSETERTVAHVRSLGAPLLRAAWADAPVAESVVGVVYVLPWCTPGYCEVNLDGETQAWYAEEDRKIDVYF